MNRFFQRLLLLFLCTLTMTWVMADKPLQKGMHEQHRLFTAPAEKQAAPHGKIMKRHRATTVSESSISTVVDGKTDVPGTKIRRTQANAATNIPRIYGCVFYTGSRDDIEQSVCAIPTNDNEKFELIIDNVNAIDGGTAVNGTYYAAYHTEYYGEYKLYIRSYDIATGRYLKEINGDASAEATDVAYNPADGKVYGCFCDPDSPDYSGYYFGTIDYTTGITTRIKELPRQMAAIAISPAGKIYVIDKQQEKTGYTLTTVGADLYEIDTLGNMTFIGKTGQLPEYRSSACIDPLSGRMFWTVSPTDECGYLYEVDLATGAATLVYQFPGDEEIVGIYIPDNGVRADSPAAATDLKAEFPEGGLSGTVSFVLPSTDLNGIQLSGELSWELTIDGKDSKTGTGTPGNTVNVPVTLTEEGMHRFSVTVSNEQGPSEETLLNVFVGQDTPVAPVVEASMEENRITVSWKPVTEAVNGGYINPSRVSYRVTRFPDNIVLSENTKETSLLDVVEIPDGLAYYYYTVEARCAGLVSTPARSPKLIIGYNTTPCSDDFNNIKTFDLYTVIDANGDGTTWGPFIGNIRVSFNTEMAMDDWLITPPVQLEAGKAYRFSIDVLTGNATAKESFEVKYGRGNTVADMTGSVIEKQSVAHTDYVKYHGFIVPEESGIHYIGIHGCSEADMYTLTVDNMSIESALNAGIPAEVTDLTAATHTNGELRADISFKAPLTDLAGVQLQSIDKIILKRDELTVKTFSSPTPGASLSFTDEVPECGIYAYNAYAVNATGEGPAAKAEIYVGVLAPSEPTNVSIVETSVPGEVTVSWDAPATDVEGNILDPQYITYGIYVPVGASDMEPLYTDLKGTSYTFKALDDADTQKFAQYVVTAKTLGGFSDGMPTPMIPVGKPYATPFRESFSHGQPASILATNSSGGAAWQLYNDESGVPAADGDNGYIGSHANYLDDYGSLMLGKVNLAGLTSPALTFYTYSIVDDEDYDDNEIDIIAICEGTAKKASTVKISDYTHEEGWVKIFIPLTEFAGKAVQLQFVSHCRSWQYTFIDAIRIDNSYDHNLTVNRLSVPTTVKAGTDFEITAEIENNGMKDASGYSVELFADDKKIDTKAGADIPSFGKAYITFTSRISVVDPAPVTFKAVAVYAADEMATDNESEAVTVTPTEPTLPVVRTLAAKGSDNGISLTWDKPDFSEFIPDAVTETFESAESWATDGAAGWTFVDRDRAGVGGFKDGSEFPGIATGSVQSFFVFDNSTPGFNDYFNNAHSGNKFLAQLYSYDITSGTGVPCDDWAISPELCGAAQTVSLYARCYDNSYPETFEILYSKGSTDPDDFIPVAEHTALSTEWTVFNANIPAGAMRMAIRCTSNFKFMFFVDDVTFIPASHEGDLILTGYNIYRDGEHVASVDADATSFDDTEADAADGHSYVVTALYNLGESNPSDIAIAEGSGIDGIASGKLTITGGKGFISISGASGRNISVFSAGGQAIATITCADGTERIAAVPGIYLVKTDAIVCKVIVK